MQRWRTDFPPPPGFTGKASSEDYDVDAYDRDLTPEEMAALDAEHAAWLHPYEVAAARARDIYFGFALPPESAPETDTEAATETASAPATSPDLQPEPA